MPKFVLIDHSIVDMGGHYYEYAARVLGAAEAAAGGDFTSRWWSAAVAARSLRLRRSSAATDGQFALQAITQPRKRYVPLMTT